MRSNEEMEKPTERFESSESLVRLFGHDISDFSSQYGAESRMSYTAHNLAGPYNIYPSYGDFTQACVFRTYGPWWKTVPSATKPFRKMPNPTAFCSEDFIEVLFEENLYPVAVQIYETYNPGAIVRIMGCDFKAGTSVDTGQQSHWMTLWSKPVVETPQRVRIFSPPIKKIGTPINMIRLEFNHQLLDYYTELDCIMLCGVRCKPSPHDYPVLEAQAEKTRVPTAFEATAEAPLPGEFPRESEMDQDVEEKLREDLQAIHLDCDNSAGDHQLFEMLPGEVILMIMGYLDLCSLGRVAQTCRLLREHAYDSILYTEVNLQPLWNKVTDSTLDSLSERCDHLQRLNMSWCGKMGTFTSSLERFVKKLPSSITCLHLSCCPFVNMLSLQVICTHCKQLKDLDLSGCRQVDNISGISLVQLRKLERLNLYRTKIDTHSAVCIIRCMPELQHLNLGSCMLLTHSSEIVQELGQHCPKLRSLDLWRGRNMQDSVFQTFIMNCPLLEELDLGWCTELNSAANSFTCIAENCKNLKKLFLTANRTVRDTDLLSLAKHSRQLQQLDILGTREISVNAVLQVLTKCPDMVMFDLSFCAGISVTDVPLIKEKFPACNIKRSFQEN